MWFEKCADSYAFLKYQIRIIVRYLMFRQGTVLSELGQKIEYFAEQVLAEGGKERHQQADGQNAY